MCIAKATLNTTAIALGMRGNVVDKRCMPGAPIVFWTSGRMVDKRCMPTATMIIRAPRNGGMYQSK